MDKNMDLIRNEIFSFEIFEKKASNVALLLNENTEVTIKKGFLEYSEELNFLYQRKEFNQSKKQDEELEKLISIDFKEIFNKQPTQLKNINNNKLKPNKQMENLMVIEENQINQPNEEIEDKDIKLLNKKRKQSDGLNELKKELLEKYIKYEMEIFQIFNFLF
jgi:hypothetical protein